MTIRVRHSIAICMATISISLFFANIGLAQESAPVLVLVRTSDAEAQKAAEYVKQNIRIYFQQDERYNNVNLEDILKSKKRTNALKAIETAKTMIQKGREAYDSLELDQAVDFFNQAIRKFEQNVAYLDSPRPISEALISLGAAYILKGEENTGKKVLARSVLIDPLAKPDPRIFNPSMMEIFNESQERAMNSPRSAVNAISNPNYAHVFMDGKFIGVTPLNKGDIPSGQHYFQLKKDGLRSYGKAIRMHAHAEESLSGNLRPITASDKFFRLSKEVFGHIDDDELHPTMQELADFVGAEHLFLAAVKLNGNKVLIDGAQFSTSSQKRLKRAQTSFLFDPDQLEEIVSEYMAMHFGASSLYEDTKSTEREFAATAYSYVPKPLLDEKAQQYISWGLLGGGGLLVGVGGIIGAVALNKSNSLQSTLQKEAESKASSGKTLALTTDIMIGLGAAAAITGTILMIIWNPASSSTETTPTNTSPAPLFQGGIAPIPGGALLTVDGTF